MEHRERSLLEEDRSKYDIDGILKDPVSVVAGRIGEKQGITLWLFYGYLQLLLKSI